MPHSKETVLSHFYTMWTEQVGTMTYGRLGKAIYECIHQYGEQDTLKAMQRYITSNRGRVMKPEWFAEQIVQYLPSQAPLVDEYGGLTPEGVRVYKEGR